MRHQEKGPIRLLYERLYVVVLVTAAAVISAYLISNEIRPVYRAQAKGYRPGGTEVFSLNDEGAGISIAPRMPTGSDEVQASLLGILRSEELRTVVANELVRRGIEGRDTDYLRKNVNFDSDKFNMLVITAWDQRALTARDMAATYWQSFHEYLQNLTKQDMAETRVILDGSITQAESELRDKMTERMNFMSARDSVDYAAEFDELSTRIRTLRTQIADIEISSATIDNKIAEVQLQIDEREPWAPSSRVDVRNPMINSVTERLDRARSDVELLKLRFTESHPDVVAKRLEISQLSSQLAGMEAIVDSSETEQPDALRASLTAELYELRRSMATQDVEIAARAAELGEQMEKWRKMPEYKSQLDVLDQDIAKRQVTLDSLRARREELRIQESRQFKYLEIIEAPSVPSEPTYPRTTLNIAIAGVLGLIAGVTLVVLMARMRTLREEQLW